MNNFWQRVFTGILFVLILAGAIYFHAFAYFMVFFLVVIGCAYELDGLLSASGKNNNFLATLSITVFIYVATFLVKSKISDASIYYLLIPLLSFFFVFELFKTKQQPFGGLSTSLLGALYIGAPFAFMHHLAFYSGGYHFELPLAVFVMVWINDTGAYLSGVTLGRHKFFERISPKKTWEGTIGGFAFTLIAAYVISLFWTDLTMVQWLVFGGVISVMAVLGDLLESMFKRSIGVKDSGSILPGHGGFLDRFDAVIFALPMAAFYIEMFVR